LERIQSRHISRDIAAYQYATVKATWLRSGPQRRPKPARSLGEGAHVDRSVLDISDDDAFDAEAFLESLLAGEDLHTVGLTWSHDAEPAAIKVREALEVLGAGAPVVAVPDIEAAEALARGIADITGHDFLVVCIVEPDTAARPHCHRGGFCDVSGRGARFVTCHQRTGRASRETANIPGGRSPPRTGLRAACPAAKAAAPRPDLREDPAAQSIGIAAPT
jgi:hypothetical protein